MEINPEEWTDLAWKAVRDSRKGGLQGVDIEDLFQCAMIGILLAARSFDDERGFATYAHWFMHREINNLVYKRTFGTHIPRVGDSLFCEMDDTFEVGYVDDDEEDYRYVDEFIASVPLCLEDKKFFADLVDYGEVDATDIYVSETGNTKQRARQVMMDIRDTAAIHMEKLRDE